MLHVLLLILKIIGIVLAVVLGLVILLLALVLFVPVRYKINLDYHEKLYADIRITWLLHIINARFTYAEKFEVKVRAFLFKLYSNENEEETDKKKEPKEKDSKDKYKKKNKEVLTSENKEKSNSSIEKVDNKKTEMNKLSSENKKSENNQKTIFDDDIYDSIQENNNCDNSSDNDKKQQHLDMKKENAVLVTKTEDVSEEDEEEIPEEENSLKKQNVFVKIKHKLTDIFNKLIVLVRKICDTIKGIINKSQEAKEKAVNKYNEIRDMINDSENREMVKFLLKQLGILWKKIKPVKYNINIRYGFEDAETTGWIAVRAAVLYGLLGMDVNIIPDFDNNIFEGNVYMKGHITLFSIGVIALRVYRNKRFKKLVLER